MCVFIVLQTQVSIAYHISMMYNSTHAPIFKFLVFSSTFEFGLIELIGYESWSHIKV